MDKMIIDQIKLYNYFQFPQPERPAPIDDDLMAMRLNFMLEELQETARAAGFWLGPNLVFEKQQTPSIKNAEQILDGLVDLQVVLLGTAYLMGFLRPYIKDYNRENLPVYVSFFEEAWRRVFEANMAKEIGVREKRGHKLDLKKPGGWRAPKLYDLVSGFYGFCKDCNCALTKEDKEKDKLKCAACRAND